MKDFTLTSYKIYLEAIKGSYPEILRFDDFLSRQSAPEIFCLIRHDVDRKVRNSLEMAKVEADFGLNSTYYFRVKNHVFDPTIIKEIHNMGHEIGYHYENLSDFQGNKSAAMSDFQKNLERLRNIVPIKTIAMHGRPLSKWDNRDLWNTENKKTLTEKLGILGEVYLDIDYSDILYLGDTGRNWHASRSNKRDSVNSKIETSINNGEQLLQTLQKGEFKKLVFQIHPERWTDNFLEYQTQWLKDMSINFVKRFL